MCYYTFIQYKCGCTPTQPVLNDCGRGCSEAPLDRSRPRVLNYSCNNCQQIGGFNTSAYDASLYRPTDMVVERRNDSRRTMSERRHRARQIEYADDYEDNPSDYEVLPSGDLRKLSRQEKRYAREQEAMQREIARRQEEVERSMWIERSMRERLVSSAYPFGGVMYGEDEVDEEESEPEYDHHRRSRSRRSGSHSRRRSRSRSHRCR